MIRVIGTTNEGLQSLIRQTYQHWTAYIVSDTDLVIPKDFRINLWVNRAPGIENLEKALQLQNPYENDLVVPLLDYDSNAFKLMNESMKADPKAEYFKMGPHIIFKYRVFKSIFKGIEGTLKQGLYFGSNLCQG